MKTCQELGWKVGDKFRRIVAGSYNVGDIVELLEDDDTDCPLWNKGGEGVFLYSSIDKFLPLENSKYARNIKGMVVDIYDVLKAWEVTCPATQHAIKKLLMPGQRGSKDKLQDLNEAEQAIQRAIELEEG